MHTDTQLCIYRHIHFFGFSSRGYMNEIKLNNQEWEQPTPGQWVRHRSGTAGKAGVITEFRYLELTLIQAERPWVMAGELQHMMMLLALG